MNKTPATEAVATMGGEHGMQIALLDAVSEALSRDAATSELAEILEQAVTYSKVHFLSERLLMRNHAYPDYEAHEAAHERLIEALQRTLSLVRDEAAVDGALRQTRAEILTHIANHDESLHQWLVAHGIGAPATPA